MDCKQVVIGAVACAAVATGAAQAELGVGAPVVVPADNTIAVIEFVSKEALFEGKLYFLGWGDSDGVIVTASDSDSSGLGQFLLDNQVATAGDSVQLEGTFNEGDVLHFAYDIVWPVENKDVFRTDVPADQQHFAWNADTGAFKIEDLRPFESDFDYDDAVFHISFLTVPSPGPLLLLGLAGIIGRARRRRC